MANWFKRQLTSLYRHLYPFTAELCEDLPESLKADRIYLVGDDGFLWQAAMLCPCGCEKTIQLSLVYHDRPSWRAHVEPNQRVTLAPSVWRTTGCHSHFFVRGGRLIWARPGAPPGSR